MTDKSASSVDASQPPDPDGASEEWLIVVNAFHRHPGGKRLSMNFVARTRLFIAILSVATSMPALADFTGKVVGVADGDTITVLHGHEQTKVRLSGIDAPEKAQPFGDLSRKSMAQLVFGKDVQVEDRKKDRYGRTIGRVWVAAAGCPVCPKKVDVGIEQLNQGLAWHFKRYEKEQPAQERELYALAEEVARAKHVGLWGDASPVAPWDWRSRSNR